MRKINWMSGSTSVVPNYDHVVIVAEENHDYGQIIGNSQAPYINSLASQGALLTNDHGNAHPSLPNYLAMYAGSTFGVTDDNTHHEPDPTLDTVLKGAGYSFTSYVDPGATDYDHNPSESFPEGKSVEQSFTGSPFQTGNFDALPTVSFVTPNLNHDMHNGTIKAGDTWLQQNLSAYANWAQTHNSLLITTWDEGATGNHIATILDGAGVAPGTTDGTKYSHYNLLSTVLAAKGLTAPRHSATAAHYDVFQATGAVDPPGTLAATVDLTTATAGARVPAGTDIASFTDSNSADPASDFTASINWNGKSAISAGKVVGSNGSFEITGSHVYTKPGEMPLSVTITQASDGNSVTASGTVDVTAAAATQPQTALHFAANGDLSDGSQSDGFNLADVSSVASANALPAGDQGLIWWGKTTGVTAGFKSLVAAVEASPKAYGIYLADEPGNGATTIANLNAEVQYVNANAPDKIAFIVAENFGTPERPSLGGYTPSAIGMTQPNDLIGLDPYPVRPQFSGGMDLSVIDAGVNAAESAGWNVSQIVPVYQAFGGPPGTAYDSWTLPTADQENQILGEWGKLTPTPAFDMAYSWGVQSNDQAISTSPDLQAVFASHNA